VLRFASGTGREDYPFGRRERQETVSGFLAVSRTVAGLFSRGDESAAPPGSL